jgi:methionyl aminopeptidase
VRVLSPIRPSLATASRRRGDRRLWRDAVPARPPCTLKSSDDIEGIRAAGRIVHAALRAAAEACVEGATTHDVAHAASRAIACLGGEPLFRNYPANRPGEGFPADACVSVSDELVHGVPGERVLCDGDLVKIDCGVRRHGWCADAAIAVGVGCLEADAAALADASRMVLDAAIDAIRPGRRWSEVAIVMQTIAEQAGYGVVRDFLGHGIGRSLHEQPPAPAFATDDFRLRHDFVLQSGLVLAVEPMLTLGSPQVRTLDDGWTVVTVDGRPACHVEHTIAVSTHGAEVLTDRA